jgi:hypothetical protein
MMTSKNFFKDKKCSLGYLPFVSKIATHYVNSYIGFFASGKNNFF